MHQRSVNFQWRYQRVHSNPYLTLFLIFFSFIAAQIRKCRVARREWNIAGYVHMKTRCKRIRKIKITWELNGFPFSVLYGKHCWTYGNIIKMKHWCITTTFCDTSTIKIFILLWHFLDVIHTFNNSLISYSHV